MRTTQLTHDASVLIVGLGIHGTAAALELASRGISVIGIERFDAGHAFGSSHGATRMTRRAYPSEAWNSLVERAFAGWDRWAERAGRSFISVTGGLYAAAEPGRLQGPGCVAVAPGQMATAMPGLRAPDGYFAVADPAAGVVAASAALDFARTAARAAGASLSYGEAMTRWSADDGGVTVETTSRTIRVGRLVLATGPWTGAVVPQLAGALEVWRIVTLTATPGQAVAQSPSLGTFSIDRAEGLVFGIPEVAIDGIGTIGLKIGVDAGPVWDPNVPNPPPTIAETAELARLMRDLVPGIDTAGSEAAACLYTMTPDRRFVVGALPDKPRVIVATACSGHGFKFGPAVGEAIADLCGGVDRPDLDMFALDRFVAQ
ncbi:FAD-dependent oxidoreductase [Lacisediminihabitans profunda]|uniref:FAD-dependent oxidoreductase n=1 Tax=Lacisediminihabitans profunda TaxID=2594790 RepID=A0A5C8US41_9MICO|nr:FAD-dependent oxidoreductase [Lacisediminihabitans profunda]TXN30406.1 FAD-dependent oxidoreductase [Lacisediminihabitans profunda]